MEIAGGSWRIETRVTPSASSSVPARRREFCPDGDLGSRNRPLFPEGSAVDSFCEPEPPIRNPASARSQRTTEGSSVYYRSSTDRTEHWTWGLTLPVSGATLRGTRC